MVVTEETLNSARRYARKMFNKLREDQKWDGHASHAAAEALRLTEEKFDLGTFGVEGFCDQNDTRGGGFSYLNTGDTYGRTVGVYTHYNTVRFVVTTWGDVAEANPTWS